MLMIKEMLWTIVILKNKHKTSTYTFPYEQ